MHKSYIWNQMNLCFNVEALSDASLRQIVGIPDIPVVTITMPKGTLNSGFFSRYSRIGFVFGTRIHFVAYLLLRFQTSPLSGSVNLS